MSADPALATTDPVRLPTPSRAVLRDATALIEAGLGTAADHDDWTRVGERYAIAIPAELATRLPNSAALRAQYLPDGRELEWAPAEDNDPIGDHAHSPMPGLVHRYPDRVLLKLHHACAVYCRFCFRRDMVGPGGAALDRAGLDAAINYIAARPAVQEVILTGGDPLLLSPARLTEIITALDAIPYVGVIRYHTRLPLAAPSRLTPALIAAMRPARAVGFVVLHINHPDELDPTVRAAIARCLGAGLILRSQSVLLAGINDNTEVLAALFRALLQAGVAPYYLHHPDLAPGTAHFRVAIAHGQALARALRGTLSGLAVPTYVIDIPGGFGKVPVEAPWVVPNGQNGYTLTDRHGGTHAYRDVL
jgi:lysine 2,3-aminomutase